MYCNMGNSDRIIRIIIGFVLAGAGFFFVSWWGLLAIVPIGTSIIGYCPFYKAFDWSTEETKSNKKK